MDDSINSPEAKKSKKYHSPFKVHEQEEHEILTDLNMSEELAAKSTTDFRASKDKKGASRNRRSQEKSAKT